MQLIAPEILLEAHGIAPAISAAGLCVGLLLWLTGWWGHRFWIVLTTTVVGGFLGLKLEPVYDTHPLLTALLLAIAAGVLALALVRVIVFAASGATLCAVVHLFAPMNWDKPLCWFLVGGMAGLLLFRFWTMLLTSFCATLLMGYSLLCLLGSLGKLDAVVTAERYGTLLTSACFAVTVVGLLIQYFLERRRALLTRLQEERMRRITQREQEPSPPYSSQKRWFSWGQNYRRAG